MSFNFKTIAQAGDLAGKTVLLRLDLNEPVINGKIANDFRITRSLKTINFLLNAGAKLFIVAHLDTKEGGSLLGASEYLKQFFPVEFVPTVGEVAGALLRARPGTAVLLENIRNNPGEVANDPSFAQQLASFADVYVNEAFSVSHRKHASIVGVPSYLPHYAGFLLAEEVEQLSEVFHPEQPFCFVLGGAKFETKVPLVKKFAQSAKHVFIGGALANDLFKAKGYEIGASIHAETDLGFADILRYSNLMLPVDVITDGPSGRRSVSPDKVLAGEIMADAGPETVAQLTSMFVGAKTILWNGTLGICEKGFCSGTEALAQAIIASGARSIIGGGDTLSGIEQLHMNDKFSFVSTGGGAMLDFLAHETLPGIVALEK